MNSIQRKQIPIERGPQTARTVCYQVLCRTATSQKFASRLLDGALESASLSDADRRLATELTLGVARREITLDAILAQFVSRERGSVEPELWRLLQLGAYQLTFTTGIPAHAAVNETVTLAKAAGQPRWTGFANGVLRALSRSLRDEFVEQPAADTVPLQDESCRSFDRKLFPDPATQPAEYFSAAFGFGERMSQRWHERFGFEELLRLGFWMNTPPPPYLRTNLLRVDRDVLLNDLRAAGVAAEPGEFPESIRLHGHVPVSQLPGFRQGWFSVQDESAMAAARLLAPAHGARVWDMCAAPGGKTAHLAELMQDQGDVLATDIDPTRLQKVVSGCDRLGLNIVQTRLIDPDGGNLPNGPFDAILLDAPCTNTGVLNKRPEARHRVTAENLAELSTLQRRLLRGGLQRLAPGGRLVYSTCSIEPEENQQVVAEVVTEFNGIKRCDEREHIPGRPADGGYQSLLLRDINE